MCEGQPQKGCCPVNVLYVSHDANLFKRFTAILFLSDTVKATDSILVSCFDSKDVKLSASSLVILVKRH